MVFYFYENAMREVDKVSVDGLVPKSAHLSHWKGNQTPSSFKADTATEIVFRYLCHPRRKELFPQIRIITNNHFDTDGLLSIWALLNPKKADPMAGRLISAAEAGDFSTFSSEEGVQINLLIEALCKSEESPLIEKINQYDGPVEAAYYKHLLPLVPDLFRHKERYRSLWEMPFKKILHAMELFEKGIIGIEEYENEGLSVVIDKEKPARQAIDHYCQGNLFLVIEDQEKREGGFGYELEYRYYTWADTVTRPPVKQILFDDLATKFNKEEGHHNGKWQTGNFPGRSMTSVLKFTDTNGGDLTSHLHPRTVIEDVLSYLRLHNHEGWID